MRLITLYKLTPDMINEIDEIVSTLGTALTIRYWDLVNGAMLHLYNTLLSKWILRHPIPSTMNDIVVVHIVDIWISVCNADPTLPVQTAIAIVITSTMHRTI